MTKSTPILAAALALCACGPNPPAGNETAATQAVDAVDSGDAPSNAAQPDSGAPLATSSMTSPPPTAPTGEVLAVSAMSGQPQPVAPAPAFQPTEVQQAVGSVTGTQTETLPSYPPRSGITTGRLCAAAIGSIMGLTELQVGIDHESPSIARVGYQRADRTRWTYDCRFDGSHITWRTVEDGRPGRWRTDPGDEAITFSMTPQGANVTVDGEVVRIAA